MSAPDSAELVELRRFVEFVNLWCYRECSANPEERLSVIQFHPTARRAAKAAKWVSDSENMSATEYYAKQCASQSVEIERLRAELARARDVLGGLKVSRTGIDARAMAVDRIDRILSHQGNIVDVSLR